MARDLESLKIRKWAGSVPANRQDPEDANLNPTLARSTGWPASITPGGISPQWGGIRWDEPMDCRYVDINPDSIVIKR